MPLTEKLRQHLVRFAEVIHCALSILLEARNSSDVGKSASKMSDTMME